jgi:hypothetical protein
MTMKRIKISSDDPSCKDAKVLRFEESINFDALIRNIANKLGVEVDPDRSTQDHWELRLHGNLLENSDEIDAGDDICLTRKRTDIPDPPLSSNNNTEAAGSSSASANNDVTEEDSEPRPWNECWAYNTQAIQDKRKRIKREPFNAPSRAPVNVPNTKEDSKASSDDSDNDSDNSRIDKDSDVEDITEKIKAESRKKKAKQEILFLSSDEDAEESDEDDDDDDDGSVEEGSDAWDPSSAEEEESEDSDFDYEEEEKKVTSSKNRKTTKKPPPEAPLKVIMEAKDLPSAPGLPAEMDDTPSGLDEVSTLVDGTGRKKSDRAVKDRIIKLLNTGFHDQSNENEAKNAMKLAQRLMKKHNLSQAILLKERQDKNEKEQNGGPANDEILKGGIVKVHIVNRKTDKPALFARWISDLTRPITNNFDVKAYSTVSRGHKCMVAFYGIYTNCQLAAYAFRVATERISQMTAAYKPAKNMFDSNISTKSSRLSYAIGIVKGIGQDVKRNIRMEKERQERKLQRARLAATKGEAYQESDNEDDDSFDGDDNKEGAGFSLAGGVSDEDKKPAAKVSTVAEEDNKNDGDGDDESLAQLGKTTAKAKLAAELETGRRLQELENLQQIAEQVLKDRGLKLGSAIKRKAITFDKRSYRQGVEDAKEIDINQRAIRDEVKIKKEEKRRT